MSATPFPTTRNQTDRRTANPARPGSPGSRRERVLTQAPREDRRAPVSDQRHRRRLRLRVRRHEDVRGGRRGHDGRPTSWRTRASSASGSSPTCSRRPSGSSSRWPSTCSSGTSTGTWPARWWSSSRSGPPSCASTMSSSSSPCGSRPTARLRGRPRRRGVERPRAAPARPPALRVPHRPDLLRPVAAAARVSRLPVGDVPQGAGRRAHRGGRLLPGGHARAVPGPRPRQADQRGPRHPAHHRRRCGWPCTCS